MENTSSHHPLDPLTASEISAAVRIIKRDAGIDESGWFETITLEEPRLPLSELNAENLEVQRRAYVCCYEPSSNRTLNGIVNLDEERIESWQHVEGAQARIVPDEFDMGNDLVKQDERFIEALAKRGVTDLGMVLVETWAAGNFGIEEEQGERIAYCHCWVSNEAGDNKYGRPIANLHPVVDLRRREVIRIDDFGVVPLPPDTSAIRPQENLRDDIKRLEITQPDGPSFKVDGYRVEWQRWNVRIGFNHREGLVLHNISYKDGDKVRPIMRRASMVEMVVPYGDPSGGNYRRNAFDTGEYGLGACLDSLKLGCDCLGYIHYFDLCTHDWNGEPEVIKNAVCMHEEDFGLLWKHTDTKTGEFRAVRSRRLVISSICTIGNYVYGFFWYFYQDGTIGVEVKATGIPFPTGIAPGDKPEFGAMVAPGIQSHMHQHTFSFRFDMCVDGENNSALEVEFEPAPLGSNNPHGNAVAISDRLLANESEAGRELDMARGRYWKIINPDSKNALGEPVAYKLAPGSNALPLLHPEAPVAKRAGFMFKHFWATPYHPEELYPAGWYPNQSGPGEGLPKWVEAKRSIENTDLVAWYTLSFNHLPRPEDWPVQPVVYANFHWMPDGFFDENPALDVPPGNGG